ncbi:MAG TPA: hypothetical protein VKV95_09900 [Terriglobia bacterium]|nr:hypothetical protein [Terriglobia bacterium]
MTQAQFDTASAPAEAGILIASKTEEGFRVYSLQTPSTIYQVRYDGEQWTCNCFDFENHKSDTTYRCAHILTVAPWPNGNHATAPQPGNGHAKDAAVPALPPAEPPVEKKRARKRSNGSVVMLLKRSVSPDGRIDSLSIEFSMGVADITSAEIKDKAAKTLELEKEIVGVFLKLNAPPAPSPVLQPTVAAPTVAKPQTQPQPAPRQINGNGNPVHARLIDIAKVKGRYGDRFCINVQVNGRWSRIFGSAEQLAADIAKAGHHIEAANIEPGLRLNLPCLVTTKPSDDGKYLNVEKVFPLNNAPKGGNNGSAVPN